MYSCVYIKSLFTACRLENEVEKYSSLIWLRRKTFDRSLLQLENTTTIAKTVQSNLGIFMVRQSQMRYTDERRLVFNNSTLMGNCL